MYLIRKDSRAPDPPAVVRLYKVVGLAAKGLGKTPTARQAT
jgi:hypothetical protein